MSESLARAAQQAAHPDASELAADTERSLKQMEREKESPAVDVTDAQWREAVEGADIV